MKIHQKISIVIMLFVLVVLSVTILVRHYYFEREIKDLLYFEFHQNAENRLGRLDQFLFERFSDIQLISSRLSFSWSEDYLSSKEAFLYLQGIETAKKTYASIEVYNKEGFKVLSTRGLRVGANDQTDSFFQGAINGSLYSSTAPLVSKELGIPVLEFSSSIRSSDGQVIGVVRAQFPIKRIHEVLLGSEHHPDRGNNEFYILNEEQQVIYSSNNHNLSDLRFSFETATPVWVDNQATIEEMVDGKKNVYYFLKEEGFLNYYGQNWIFVSEIKSEYFDQQLDANIRNIAFSAILTVLLAIPASILLAKKITTQIATLNSAALKLAGGDFRLELNPNEGEDEIRELTRSFQMMAKQFEHASKNEKEYTKKLNEEIKKRTTQLKQKIEELEFFNRISIGRELKMIELKTKVRELEERLSGKKRFNIAFKEGNNKNEETNNK